MKALIICSSAHKGNTLKIAEAMAGKLKAKTIEPQEVRKEDLENCDLVGFGSGIYFGRHHKTIFDLIQRLPLQNKKPAFIFSTAGLPKLRLVWHNPLKEALLRKGFELTGEFCCYGHDEVGPLKQIGGINKGRPNLHDLNSASLFAGKINLTSSDKIAL